MSGIQFTRRAVVGGMLGAGVIYAPRRAGAQTAEPRPVTIANAAGAVNLTMQELMKQQGFLETFGLQPDVINVADGSKIASGIIGGAIDITTMSGFGQIFPAIERGGKIKILAGAALTPSLGIFTSKPDIRTLKDLEGRTVGTGSIGALLHQLVVALLRKNAVDVGKVRFANIGASVDVFRATFMGTVDAGTGELAIVDQQDKYKVKLLEHGNMALELPEYTYQGAWTSDQAIERERDTLVRTLAAYAKLYRFVQSPKAKDAFLQARKTLFPKGSEEESMAQWHVIQTYKPFAVDLVLGEDRLTYMQKLNVELETQTRILPFDMVADMSLARDALSLLG